MNLVFRTAANIAFRSSLPYRLGRGTQPSDIPEHRLVETRIFLVLEVRSKD